jgi:hypothetical protein
MMRTRTAQVLKNRNDFNMDDIRTQEFVSAIQAVRLSITGPSVVTMAKAPNKRTELRSEIKSACSTLTDEEISLYECTALTSWESR